MDVVSHVQPYGTDEAAPDLIPKPAGSTHARAQVLGTGLYVSSEGKEKGCAGDSVLASASSQAPAQCVSPRKETELQSLPT